MGGCDLVNYIVHRLVNAHRSTNYRNSTTQPTASKIQEVANQVLHSACTAPNASRQRKVRLAKLFRIQHELGRHDHRSERGSQIVPENRQEHLLRVVEI